MTSKFRLLRENPRKWWYHKSLRERGQHSMARQREHESTRNTLRHIRTAIYLSVGRGGLTLYGPEEPTENGSQSWRLQGYTHDFQFYCDVLPKHVPWCDTRTIDFDVIWKVAFKSPLIAQGEPEEPSADGSYGSMTRAPIGVHVAIDEHFGGTVHWGSLDPEHWRAKAQPTIKRLEEALCAG